MFVHWNCNLTRYNFWLMYLQIQKLSVSVGKTANKELIHEFQQIEKRLREGQHITAQVISQWKKSFSFLQWFFITTHHIGSYWYCVFMDQIHDVFNTGFLRPWVQLCWSWHCLYNDITYLNQKIWFTIYVIIYVVSFSPQEYTWSQ